MKKRILGAVLVGICFFAVNSLATAKTLYVRSYLTYLLTSPEQQGKKIVKLVRGTAVEQISLKGDWINVEVNNQNGWLQKRVLTSTPVKEGKSLLSKKVDIATKARKRASSYTSTAAARGLTSMDQPSGDSIYKPDYEALEMVEAREIDEATAVEFLASVD
ncbi:MAG: hypothetical protein HQ517_15145 [SAR324 cluster bacterium]|nr:hypothetical protein [SAR324 cluster bacterium]